MHVRSCATLKTSPAVLQTHIRQSSRRSCATAAVSGRILSGNPDRSSSHGRQNFSPYGRALPSYRSNRRRCAKHTQFITSAAAFFKPYPYNKKDYFQVCLLMLAHSPAEASPMGTVILSRIDEKGEKEDREHSLLLQIGGDSLLAISSVVMGTPHERPVALDLLWKVLERGQDISKREWKLIRVAIVDIQNSTYIGRLFFGDRETGEVVWDCDCRPSDGMWLSFQAKCPLYVHQRIWRHHRSRTRELVQGDDETARYLLGPDAAAATESEDLTGTKMFTTIRQDDPEPVKRLKREMAVALSEEDYSSAARIRDHPFMKLAVQIMEERLAGRETEAKALQVKLQNAVKGQQ
ncbi:TPA: hypothetical protein ACH3X3_000713 [Trebouxia sp. C0006]